MYLINVWAVLLHAVVYAAIVVFAMVLSEKWGLNRYYQIHRKKWMPKPCAFCYAFWLGVSIILVHYLLAGVHEVANVIVTVVIIPVFALFLFRK